MVRACSFRHFWAALCLVTSSLSLAQEPAVKAIPKSSEESTAKSSPEKSEKRDAAARQQLADVVALAFQKVHDGWSTDEVVLKDDLNQKFVATCKEQLPDVSATDFNWTLLNLRKAGKLGAVATKRARQDHDDYQHAAEIAARFLQDKHKLTIDRLLCDLERRAEFDKSAIAIVPGVEPYRLRKAAFGLRKARQLQPELVLRVADWDRQILTHVAAEIVADGKLVPELPGVYIFRDATGYLYIGESANLRQRVNQHLDRSDRKSLASYLAESGKQEVTVELHAFGKDSPAKDKTRRRAYESELIRSRKPRLNIAP